MGYNNIIKFTENEKKPYEYCLDFEYANSKYTALSPIERYLAYKSTGVKVDRKKQSLTKSEEFCLHSISTYGDIPDCDGSDGRSLLMLDVYNKLWNWKKGYYAMGEIQTPCFSGEFGGDTMNSMQTVFNALLKFVLSRPENDDLACYRKNSYSFMDCLQIYCDIGHRLISELEKVPEFVKYASLYHTVGNMVLVPRRFNAGRYAKTFDFWDSSLAWLKNDGYSYGSTQIFDRKNFTKYINYFYLWDYVDCVDGEYRVKPLFESHSDIKKGSVSNSLFWTNIATEQDLKQFLNNACKNIERRGKLMSKLVKLKASDKVAENPNAEALFSFIQSEEFLNTAHTNVYVEIEKILLTK